MYWLIRFQFHYGSIKSTPVQFVVCWTPGFQFHYGSIKSDIGTKVHLTTELFQFHYGSIKSLGLYVNMDTTGVVSIPLWFD